MKPTGHKTKIVATIGPASDTVTCLIRMLRAGMRVARLNLAHSDPDHHARTIDRIRRASARSGYPVAILADLPGPKLRIGPLDPDPVVLARGQPFVLTTEPVTGDARRASLPLAELPRAVRPGDAVFLNDGFIELRVETVRGNEIHCRVVVGGELRSHKGVNIPKLRIPLPAFTEQDQRLLAFACEQGVDAVSISFVASAGDVHQVRQAAQDLGAAPYLIAKIERAAALERIDAILAAADGIMIARGDLGVETPIETIALTQKRLIRKANAAGKPVITANQMLESMTVHSRPTRAEATDVANAVLDGTDAVMLSEESALGRFPVEAVRMLGRIARHAEAERERRITLPEPGRRKNVQEVIALDVATTVLHLGIRHVFTPTETGATARRIARFHLPAWTIALSPHPATCQRLLFSYGVHPVHTGEDGREWRLIACDWLHRHGIRKGPVIVTQGPSRGHPGETNRLEIIDRIECPG
ncbi:pyruvate kinase [Methylomarinovum caldicuralii]|uniref:Pyruvate kinase n=1 Tax=Methylomarinovum caldicuralii TaxID=438856 RepID=A0AAU9CB74_9GAMM|nr:pyruvate kinase [Methylomarinovum caldicuralii]BCX81754.1 pyruvate kinase [Methylomarinovum caldicuralii]